MSVGCDFESLRAVSSHPSARNRRDDVQFYVAAPHILHHQHERVNMQATLVLLGLSALHA